MAAGTRFWDLRNAVARVLGAEFEHALRAVVDGAPWYNEHHGEDELFCYWVRDRLTTQANPSWVFELVRASERRIVCDHLGIPREDIVGKNIEQMALLLLHSLGWPATAPRSAAQIAEDWDDIAALIDNGEDEKAAICARQKAERVLRIQLHFFLSTGYVEGFEAVLRDPGSLRVPARLASVASQQNPDRGRMFAELVAEDGWADLGFLGMATRKFSARLEEVGTRHISGGPLTILTATDHDSFNGLARALQCYAHDRGAGTRQNNTDAFAQAVQDMRRVVSGMAGRGVVPDELVVVEAGANLFGRVLRGATSTGEIVTLSCDECPDVGAKVSFVRSAARDHARCIWTHSAW